MIVTFQDLEGRQYDLTGVEKGQLVDRLKQKVYGITGVKGSEQTLLYLGQELVDGTLLSEYNVVDGNINISVAISDFQKHSNIRRIQSLSR